MYTYDVIQIVDTYPRFAEKREQSMRIDPDIEAQSLSALIKQLGRNARKIAIVAEQVLFWLDYSSANSIFSTSVWLN